MSKLLRQDQSLDAVRRDRIVRATAGAAPDSPAAPAGPPARRRMTLQVCAGLGAAAAAAGFLALALPLRHPASSPQARPQPSVPLLASHPAVAPSADPSPAARMAYAGGELRLRMDRAMAAARLAEVQRVMGMMDTALRHAAQAYGTARPSVPQARLTRGGAAS